MARLRVSGKAYEPKPKVRKRGNEGEWNRYIACHIPNKCDGTDKQIVDWFFSKFVKNFKTYHAPNNMEHPHPDIHIVSMESAVREWIRMGSYATDTLADTLCQHEFSPIVHGASWPFAGDMKLRVRFALISQARYYINKLTLPDLSEIDWIYESN